MELNAEGATGGRSRRSLIAAILGAAVVIAFLYYLYANAGQYLSLFKLSVPGLLALFALTSLFPVLNGLQNSLLYRSLGLSDFSDRDGILIAAATSLANQLPLPGGIVSKGYYLKRKYSLSYATFFTSSLALFVCFICLEGWIGLVTLVYLQFIQRTPISPALWLGFGLMGSSLLVLVSPVDRLRLPSALHQRLQAALAGWTIIRHDPGMVFKSLALQAVIVALLALRYQIAMSMLSQQVTLPEALLMSNASVLTQLVSLAPGGLGVREAIVGAVASAFGLKVAVSIAAVTLDRLVATLVIFITGGISTIVLGREIGEMRPVDAPADSARDIASQPAPADRKD